MALLLLAVSCEEPGREAPAVAPAPLGARTGARQALAPEGAGITELPGRIKPPSAAVPEVKEDGEPFTELPAAGPGDLVPIVSLLDRPHLPPERLEYYRVLLEQLKCGDAELLRQNVPGLISREEARNFALALVMAWYLPREEFMGFVRANGHRLFEKAPEAGFRFLEQVRDHRLAKEDYDTLVTVFAARTSMSDRKLARKILDTLASGANKNWAAYSTAVSSGSFSRELPAWWAARITDPRTAEDAVQVAALESYRHKVATFDQTLAFFKEKKAFEKGTSGIAAEFLIEAASREPAALSAKLAEIPAGLNRSRILFALARALYLNNDQKAARELADGMLPVHRAMLFRKLVPAPKPAPETGAGLDELHHPWMEDWGLFSQALAVAGSYPRAASDGCRGIQDAHLADECLLRLVEAACRKDLRHARALVTMIEDPSFRLEAALRVLLAEKQQPAQRDLENLSPLFASLPQIDRERTAFDTALKIQAPGPAFYLMEKYVSNASLRCSLMKRLGALAPEMEEVMPSSCDEHLCFVTGILSE